MTKLAENHRLLSKLYGEVSMGILTKREVRHKLRCLGWDDQSISFAEEVYA